MDWKSVVTHKGTKESMVVHVFPANEEDDHKLEVNCPCGPVLSEENEFPVLTHKAKPVN